MLAIFPYKKDLRNKIFKKSYKNKTLWVFLFVIILKSQEGDKGLICALPTAGNMRVNYCIVFEQYCTVYTHTYVTHFELNIYLGQRQFIAIYIFIFRYFFSSCCLVRKAPSKLIIHIKDSSKVFETHSIRKIQIKTKYSM